METVRFRAACTVKGSFYKSSAFPFARNSRRATSLVLAQGVLNHVGLETHTSELDCFECSQEMSPNTSECGAMNISLALSMAAWGRLSRVPFTREQPSEEICISILYMFIKIQTSIIEPVLGSNKHPPELPAHRYQ